jgi:HK97 family phage major capsid protein
VAVTAATVTGDFSGFLNADQSGPIFDAAMRTSVVQQLARQVPLGINGQEIPITSTKPVAGWVAEAGQKPATQGTMSLKTMTPKKLAAIAVVSAEVVRANPGNYVNLLRPQLAEAFAIAFDSAALHGTSSPFTTNIDQTTKSVEFGTNAAGAGSIYADLNAGLKLLVDDGKRLTGFAFDVKAEPLFNAAVDTTGRPLFVDSPTIETAATVQAGRVLGRPAFMGEGISTPVVTGTPNTGGIVGYGGDWTQAAWGVVGGISYDVSTEATVTINGALTSLWEHNLLAVRAEAEYGWLVNDTAAFVEYANATA